MYQLLTDALTRITGVDPQVTRPEVATFGDYATPVALRLAKERKQAPMAVAADVAIEIQTDDELQGIVASVEVKSPGFLNISLTQEAHQKALEEMVSEGITIPQVGKDQKILLESLAANIAKVVHVGHLRNAVLGVALGRLFEATGHEVYRWNYLGDWGTQIGKVMVAYKKWGNKEELEKDALGGLLSLYVRFNKEAKEDESLNDEARDAFRKLEEGDAEARELWVWFRESSLGPLKAFCERIGAAFDNWDGEAAYQEKLVGIIDLLSEKKLLVESEGAKIVDLTDENIPVAMIQKSDGGSLYLTRDLALLKDRFERFPDTRILYVVGNEQALNFQQLFAIGEKVGWPVQLAKHVKYGLLLDAEGKKLSTRDGGTVAATDVLDEASKRIAAIILERGDTLPLESIEAIGTGAVQYALLKDQRTSDIPFDWDRLLDFRGDSGPYLQYTYARLSRIIEKYGEVKNVDLTKLVEDRELELIRLLDAFPRAVVRSVEELQTNHVALYLNQLASSSNAYYQNMPILNDEDTERVAARVQLLLMVSTVLKEGMHLLGIKTVERV